MQVRLGDCEPSLRLQNAQGWANSPVRLTGYPEVISPEQTFNDAGQKSSSRKSAQSNADRTGALPSLWVVTGDGIP
jgi:hypothetical protein